MLPSGSRAASSAPGAGTHVWQEFNPWGECRLGCDPLGLIYELSHQRLFTHCISERAPRTLPAAARRLHGGGTRCSPLRLLPLASSLPPRTPGGPRGSLPPAPSPGNQISISLNPDVHVVLPPPARSPAGLDPVPLLLFTLECLLRGKAKRGL